MKIITKVSLVLFVLLFLPAIVLGANDVTVETGLSIVLSTDGSSYSVGTQTVVQSYTVNTDNIQFVVEGSSKIDLTSADRKNFTVSNAGTCTIDINSCTNDNSALFISCPSGMAERTITVTPSGTCGSAGGGGGLIAAPGGGGGGGGESSNNTETTTPDAEESDAGQLEPIQETLVTETFVIGTPAVVTVGSVSHTVIISAASEKTATVTIESDPITLDLVKDEAKNIDTDADGTDDTRVTYLGLVGDDPQLELVALALSENTVACSLAVGKAYKHSASPAVYYISEAHNEDGTVNSSLACARRAFTSSKIFFTYFGSWDDVEIVSQSQLDAIPNDTLGFMSWGPNYDPKYGALVKVVTDPKVYLLLDTDKYWITNETVFTTLGYPWNWVEDIAVELLNKYTSAGEIDYTDHHPNFTIVKYADSPKVYRLEPDPDDSTKQVKRYIPDEATFESLGFRWDRIVEISDNEVYMDGEEFGATGTVLGIKITKLTSFLGEGSAGKEVIFLQQKLRELGYFTYPSNTGTFGPITAEAVRAFQTTSGIDAVGYVGPVTRAALNAL